MMKKECSIVIDVLPLYLENMVSEDTTEFVKEHLENCPDCAAEFERLKSGKQIDVTGFPQREHDAEIITAVKKKISKRILKIVGAVCLVFAVLFSAVLLYMSIDYPVTKDNISLSAKRDSEYAYIILQTEAGKSLQFDSITEDILNERNEVCGQRFIISNLHYHNDFSKKPGTMCWGRPVNMKGRYMEVVVELENERLLMSN